MSAKGITDMAMRLAASRRAAIGLALAAALGLGACERPPASVYAHTSGASADALDIGSNSAHEVCTLQPDATGGRIYCGDYLQSAGQLLKQPQAGDLTAFVTSSNWRTTIDRRFQCGNPTSTTVLGQPGLEMACTERQGGWPHVIVATDFDGTLYVAEAVKPVEAVIPRAIGVLSGRMPAVVAAANPQANGLATQRAAQAAINVEGAGAIAEVTRLLARGAKENQEANFAAAEAAYRAAVSLQEKVVGNGNPALAVPLARLALQISNQGRYTESDQLFAQAVRLAASPDQLDPVAVPSVAYLQALDQLNRNRPADALALLDKAEAGYEANVPPDALVPRPPMHRSSIDRLSDNAFDASLLEDPTSTAALNGLIETRRYRAVALVALGRQDEAATALAQARSLYEGRDPRLAARFYRTAGMAAKAAGQGSAAVSDLGLAVDKFAAALPDSEPLARTELLRAGELATAGRNGAAAGLCREAAHTLETLKGGASATLIVPCLHALSEDAGGSATLPQPVQLEMFAMAQLAQGSVTSRQIAVATARLAEGARDPRVAEAIRHRDTVTDQLDALDRKRAEVAAAKGSQSELSDLDDQIRKTREELSEAGEALQAAAPGFAALVQESVSAQDAQALLAPHEALVSVVMDQNEGWSFLLRHDRIVIGRFDGGTKRINALVTRFRAGTDPGADNQPPPFDIAAAQELYTATLGPVSAGLTDVTALDVAPSGTLLSIPFGALLTGPASADALNTAPFLIRKVTVSHVPSVASFVNLRQSSKTAQAPEPWFGMGDYRPPTLRQAIVSFPPETCGQSARELASLPPLPGSQKELEVARRLLGASPGDEMLGASFTAKNVRAAPLNRYRVLHFATHAVLPGELRCQSEPAVLTSTPEGAPDASGGLLTASQVAQLDLNAELVILAACNTGGQADAGAGESLSGLARSFFFAGARSLLVTHWDANDASTTYLTALFLGNLQANPDAGPAAALAMAQRHMLDEATGGNAAVGQPFYWAVTALIGGRGARTGGTVADTGTQPTGG
jgi:CHAT domain-containing protein